MADFFAELKRRHIYRVAAAYAVVAWVLLQIVNNVAPVLDLPVWVARAFLLLLVIGFPITVLIAWMRELAPADGGTARSATGKLDWALIAALVVVIALVSYQQLAPTQSAKSAAQQPASVAPAPAAQAAGISIAVLPFTNLSGDAAQEFFSDGMTEEITSALAKVPNLRVVGRTSAFQFKGENKDLRAIGQALSATHLIEGSVRKDGNLLRITAQLIKSDDGTHLWTESYDRELKSVFAVQEDIAQAIAGALRVPLGLQQGGTLVRSQTKNDASYEDYLRAKALVRTRREGQLVEAANLLEQVVVRDPDFVPAWALLGLAYDFAAIYHPEMFGGTTERARSVAETYFPKAETASLRAIQLDPKNPDGYVSLALVQSSRGKFLLAGDSYSRALALDPSNPDALNQFSYLLMNLGYLKQALPMRQRLQALEPFVPIYTQITAQLMAVGGQTDEAVAMLKPLPFGGIELAGIFSAQGRYSEAADALDSLPRDAFAPATVDAAVRLLRTAPRKAASPQSLPALGLFSWVYLYVGAPDRALDFREDSLKIGNALVATLPSMWGQSYASIRKTDRFKTFIRNAGFVDYWSAKGWPDLCRPVGADDFVCD